MSIKLPKFAYKAAFSIKKHSPEILVVSGVIGLVGAGILACKNTTKAQKVLEETKKSIEDINVVVNDEDVSYEEYNEDDAVKDKIIVYSRATINLAKVYAPSLVLGGLSVVAIFSGNNILKKRLAAVAAAYAAVDTGFREYRNRVVERFGEDIDKELKYGLKSKKITKTEKDEEGKRHRKTETVYERQDVSEYSPYMRIFDDANPNWSTDPTYRMAFLKTQLNYAQDLLDKRGWLFLNEVYASLGFREVEAGQVVGWIRNDDPDYIGDNHVSFGIDLDKGVIRDFINGYEEGIILDFNVDGIIIDKAFK